MNSIFKTPLLFGILGLALHTIPSFAESSSDSSSTGSTQSQKTSATPADQPDAQPSTVTTRSDAVKGSTSAHPVDSTAAHPLEQSASGKEDTVSSAAALQGPALFKLIDTDKDGRISSAEFIAYGTAPDGRKSGAGKTAPSGTAHSNSSSGSAAGNASAKSDSGKTTHSDDKPAAKPEPASPGAGILTSTDTRAGKYTAEVFENLDINHDKFLSQAELDALIPAHQISQP